ncbi:MAG: VWA domain-containing protein [Pseudomonadota bacterium]
MTEDPLDQLRSALKRQTPAPSETARHAALRAAADAFAEKNESAAQGSAGAARPTSDRTENRGGLISGVLTMLSTLTQPRVLMGTSALATLAIAVAITQNVGGVRPVVIPADLSEAEVRLEETVVLQDRDAAASIAPQGAPVAAPAPSVATSQVQERRTRGVLSNDRLVGGAEMIEAPAKADSRQSAPSDRQLDSLGFAPSQPQLNRMPVAPSVQEEPQIGTLEGNTEAFPKADPNSLKITAEAPVSTFSIDADTASYALIRQSLNNGQLPPRDAVRIEEILNYFDYDYPAPETSDVPFRTSVSVAPTPWNPDTKLMHIGIQGYDIAPQDRPPLNLVFLIDTSGSMNEPKKLPLLVQSFKLLLTTLGAEDSVAIVTYAGSAGMALEPTPASESAKILQSLTQLSAGGSTAGQRGLQQAYALAEQMSQDGEVSRVILATDGDFNVGISDPDALKDYIAEQRDSGTYLSVLGFGRGNYQDVTLQALAQNGNGTAAYIDTLAEAQKVLVEDVAGSLFPIAGDVKIQVEFNPAQISEYRLIGYETRALKREDFNNDAVDAGEIGAGHQVTALYEITPQGSPAERVSDLRYAAPTPAADDPRGEYAFLKLRYKLPGSARSRLIETPVTAETRDIAPSETQFAAAAAGFGMLLRGNTEIVGWGMDEARALAAGHRGDDPFGYRSELVSLMRIAAALE